MNIPTRPVWRETRQYCEDVDWSKTNGEIGRARGYSTTFVRRWRAKGKLPLLEIPFQARKKMWANVDWSLPVKRLAISLNVPKDQVTYWKNKLGISDSPDAYKPISPTTQTILAKQRRQTAKQLYATQCKTYADVAKIMNCSPMAIPHLIHSNRHIAQGIVRNALEQGRLRRPEKCEACGVKPKCIHGHHNDYSKPLEVVWLCSKCHGAIHRLINHHRKISYAKIS